MGIPRKPVVRAIRGEFQADILTDADYAHAVEAQDAVLFAQGVERKILGQIRARLVNGAKDAGRKYYFDSERGIVRRRERESVRKKVGEG